MNTPENPDPGYNHKLSMSTIIGDVLLQVVGEWTDNALLHNKGLVYHCRLRDDLTGKGTLPRSDIHNYALLLRLATEGAVPDLNTNFASIAQEEAAAVEARAVLQIIGFIDDARAAGEW
jgi:hypothetical protein